MGLEGRESQPMGNLPEKIVHELVFSIAMVRTADQHPPEQVELHRLHLERLGKDPRCKDRIEILSTIPEEKFGHLFTVMFGDESPRRPKR